MSRPATDKSLLSYDDYHKFKDKFDKNHVEIDGLDEKQFLGDPEFNTTSRIKYQPYLKTLLKHIRNRGIFLGDDHKPCSYLSYILSKDLQTKLYEYNPETFEMFQDFLRKYNSRHGFNANICSNTLVYVFSDIYDKMDKLYELYNRYLKLKREYLPGENTSCPAVSFFLHEYKEFINKHKVTDQHYKNILEDFRNQIHDSLKLYNENACIINRFSIEKVKFYNLAENNMPKASDEERQRNNVEHQVSKARNSLPEAIDPLPKARDPLPEARSPPSHPKVQTFRATPQTYGVESERAHEPPQPLHEETQSFQETLAPNAHHAERQQVQEFAQRITAERDIPIEFSQVHPHYGSLESSGESSYSEPNTYLPVLQSSKEVGDTSSSVMNTITSALRDVEPGPVLGVSGGMGVLFLLFKYTPVGSFFGGRRGRFRQIPRTFGGFPPGDFANFQEYGGGYVGYSQMDMPFQGE